MNKINLSYEQYRKKMEFCPLCDNMFYLNLEDIKNANGTVVLKEGLKYICHSCGFEQNKTNGNIFCVMDTQIKKENTNNEYVINKYTKDDPTLPRVSGLTCPSCQGDNITMKRINASDLTFMYICCGEDCNMAWKISN